MRYTLWVLLLSLTATAQDTTQPTPKYGWKQIGTETIALNASQLKYYLLPQAARWRFDFKADAAVSTGVMTAEQFGQWSNRYVPLAAFKNFGCVKTSVLETAVACNVPQPNARLVMRDERGPFTRAAGIFSTARGNGAMADRATRPNKVTVTFYRWACVENCPQ